MNLTPLSTAWLASPLTMKTSPLRATSESLRSSTRLPACSLTLQPETLESRASRMTGHLEKVPAIMLTQLTLSTLRISTCTRTLMRSYPPLLMPTSTQTLRDSQSPASAWVEWELSPLTSRMLANSDQSQPSHLYPTPQRVLGVKMPSRSSSDQLKVGKTSTLPS